MSRSHSRRTKPRAAASRRRRREAAQRPRWRTIGVRVFLESPLGWLVIALAFVPVLVYDAVTRIAERIRG